MLEWLNWMNTAFAEQIRICITIENYKTFHTKRDNISEHTSACLLYTSENEAGEASSDGK